MTYNPFDPFAPTPILDPDFDNLGALERSR